MRRAAAYLLTWLIMVSMFSACSAGNDTPAEKPPNAHRNPVDTASPPADKPNYGNEGVLPLVKDKLTLEAWWGYLPSAAYYNDVNDMEVIKEFERRTNVHVLYTVPPVNAATESLNILLNSGVYPDIFWLQDHAYPGGGDKAIEDGVFLRLNDLIRQYAPNYREIRENWGDIYRKMTITDYGNIWGMAHITRTTEPPWTGLVIRQDWLDDVGLQVPLTVDDWETALRAFRTEKGADGALTLPYLGRFYNSEFASAFGVANGFYQLEGKVRYGYIEPGYKEYLALMRRWYEEGLIDPDFTSNSWRTLFYAPDDYWAAGYCGAAAGLWAQTADALVENKTVSDSRFYLSAVNVPRLDAHISTGIAYQSYPVRGFAAVAATTMYPEICVRWLDYKYSREGALLLNYGVEGKSYDLVNGKPAYQDWIFDKSISDVEKQTWYIGGDTVGLVYYERMFQGAYQKALNAYSVWSQDSSENVLPKITLTADEASRYSSLMADIETLLNESIVMFITGVKPLAEWETMVRKIESMGIREVIDIEQAALDRYNAR